MYISLSQGRKDPSEGLSWGLYGPIIGPVSYRELLGVKEIYSPDKYESLTLYQVDRRIYFDGVFYEEIEFIDDHDSILRATVMRDRIINFDEFKKINDQPRQF